VIWVKNASPNRKDYFKNAWEYVMCFRPKGSSRYFDLEAVGLPPLYRAGGKFRQRDTNGKRKIGSEYPQSKIARPADIIGALDGQVDLLYRTVGGGHMGSDLAHANAAPYPESLVFPLIAALTKPGELVIDPFSGSGTTSAVAKKLGRNSIGFDRDDSMVNLSKLRVEEVP
jgi:DNA modification methylase